MKKLWNLVKREEGLESGEYALLGALILIVIILAVTAFGDAVRGVFQNVADTLAAHV